MSQAPTSSFPDSWGRLGEIPPCTPKTLVRRGAFGEVYRRNKDGIQMAVKRIRVTDSSTADIEREMNIVSQLAHKHIIQCYGVDRDANYVSIITDYAEGGNLDDAAPRLNWDDKKRIVVEVARGLAYLHSQSIIHRDIKGGNILLTKHDEVKLCDFGIAKIIASATCASSYMRKGTTGFMAPELMRARPAYSTMSDVYALGVVMKKLVEKDHTPPDYEAIMNRCLNEDPEKRPTVEEIVGAFYVVYRPHDIEEIDQVKTEQGPSADEEFDLGRRLYFGSEDGPEIDHAAGVEMLLRSAHKGHPEAQTALGNIYQFGVGVLRDYIKAAEWLQMAADKGFAPAQTGLAKLYLNGGTGVPQDYSRAVDQLRAAANQGYIDAYTILGQIYFSGNGVVQDDVEAIRWFQKAVEGGCPVAQTHVGRMYYEGRCVEQDFAQSNRLWLLAASKGVAYAYLNLSEAYFTGHGVRQDGRESLKWLLKAAEEGDIKGQYEVGMRYIYGARDVPKNPSRGRMWLKKAADQGHEGARHFEKVVDQALLY